MLFPHLEAARDLSGLQSRGVTAVVNCTTNIDCFHTGSLDYFTFDVAFWRREVIGRLKGDLQIFLRNKMNKPKYTYIDTESEIIDFKC